MIKDDILGVNIENINLSDIPEGAVKISIWNSGLIMNLE